MIELTFFRPVIITKSGLERKQNGFHVKFTYSYRSAIDQVPQVLTCSCPEFELAIFTSLSRSDNFLHFSLKNSHRFNSLILIARTRTFSFTKIFEKFGSTFAL
jgi:hypothetical protein